MSYKTDSANETAEIINEIREGDKFFMFYENSITELKVNRIRITGDSRGYLIGIDLSHESGIELLEVSPKELYKTVKKLVLDLEYNFYGNSKDENKCHFCGQPFRTFS